MLFHILGTVINEYGKNQFACSQIRMIDYWVVDELLYTLPQGFYVIA